MTSTNEASSTIKNSDIIFNEQKMREAEVSLTQLEQKVDRLENLIQNNQNFNTDILADVIAKTIDK